MDPVDGPILASLLGIACHLESFTTFMKILHEHNVMGYSWPLCIGVHQSENCRPLLDGPICRRAGAAASHPQQPLPAGFTLAPSCSGKPGRNFRVTSVTVGEENYTCDYIRRVFVPDPEEAVQRQHGRPSTNVGQRLCGIPPPKLESNTPVRKEQCAGAAGVCLQRGNVLRQRDGPVLISNAPSPEQRDDMEAIPGYLSLHQTAELMTLKWTPNQLMNGNVGELDSEKR